MVSEAINKFVYVCFIWQDLMNVNGALTLGFMMKSHNSPFRFAISLVMWEGVGHSNIWCRKVVMLLWVFQNPFPVLNLYFLCFSRLVEILQLSFCPKESFFKYQYLHWRYVYIYMKFHLIISLPASQPRGRWHNFVFNCQSYIQSMPCVMDDVNICFWVV